MTHSTTHTECLRAALTHLFGSLHVTTPPQADILHAATEALQNTSDDTILGQNDHEVLNTLLGSGPAETGITAGALRAQALRELIRRAGLRGAVSNATIVTATPFGPVAEYAGSLERTSAAGEELTPLHTAGYYAQFDVEGVPHPTDPALLIRATLITVTPAPVCGTETTEHDLALMVEIRSGRAAGTVPGSDRQTVLLGLSQDAPDLLTEAWEDATGQLLSAAQITTHFRRWPRD